MDAIDREKTINKLMETAAKMPEDEKARYEVIALFLKNKEEFPPVEIDERNGRWEGSWYDGYADGNPVYEEWRCSECGAEFKCEDMDFDYCPRCGAKMSK